MTLRARLTTAFLAVVLGPVLLGAVFVGTTATAVSRNRLLDRLDLATTTARSSVGTVCQRLRAAAEAVAALTGPAGPEAAARSVVDRGLAAAVRIEDANGATVALTPQAPAGRWADCAGAETGGEAPRALAARLDLRDATGAAQGAVYAVQPVDQPFVARLAGASGAAVTLAAGGDRVLSTEGAADRNRVARAGAALPVDVVGDVPGRYLRRAGPSTDQPLPLVLSVRRDSPRTLYAGLAAAVLLAAALAVLIAWWLARGTTRPLAELVAAADRVAAGNLATRVPVRPPDELSRLGSAFNRMTREMQTYVAALTAGRDQLRGHLAVLGDTLSSTHDLNRILQVILQTALAATGARAGAVLLLEPATGALVGQSAEGLAERWPVDPLPVPAAAVAEDADESRGPDARQLRVPLGEGIVGGVAATGEARRGRVEPGGDTLSPHEPRCVTYVAVPFAAPPRPPEAVGDAPGRGASPVLGPPPAARGVLVLYDRLGGDEFDDADLSTLRTFAGQAAVAVDNVRMHEEAQRLSLTDPLTGLWNYRHLKESVRREVERASRFGRTLAVLALDLDRFKEVNDTHGHAAGDAVLIEFARRVRAEIREVDLAFRQGGEEFVLVLPETDARGGATVAERLGAAVRETAIPLEGQGTVRVTVSIGIAVYPDHATTGPQVLTAADDALYAAKAAGRDTHRVAAEPAPQPATYPMPVRAVAFPPEDDLPRAGADTDLDDDDVASPDEILPPSPGGVAGGPHP
ncbi:diguanylate cyclase, partial [Rhizomonospora bruguierae]|uniref:diguanylate cyclase n=1 Tax=Rhizomonospora bruguierae TaxID=1581705 RepID=UPI001BCCBF76